MQTWLQSKLDHITQEFLAGDGYGAVFEASFLAYLECLVACQQGASKAGRVWSEWADICAQDAPKDEKVQCLSNRVTDRKALVDRLQGFQICLDGSGPAPDGAPVNPPAIETEGDLFELFD